MRKAPARARSRTSTLGQQVHERLRSRIMAGVLSPGERRSLRAMAADLGVSVQPVRAAVASLVADRALEVLPNRAVRVPVLSRVQFRELTAIRLAIEGFAAERAARFRTPVQLADIRRHDAAFRRVSGSATPRLDKAVAANQAFHFAVYRAAGLPELMPIIEGLWLRIGPVLNLDLRSNLSRSRVMTSAGHHGELLQAIARGDGRAARQALEDDIGAAAIYIESQDVLVGPPPRRSPA
jgi:DNA-binding GntR family transcriptional regulator